MSANSVLLYLSAICGTCLDWAAGENRMSHGCLRKHARVSGSADVAVVVIDFRFVKQEKCTCVSVAWDNLNRK